MKTLYSDYSPAPPPSLSSIETGKGEPIFFESWAGKDVECGQAVGWAFCSAGHRKPIMKYCFRQECPNCHELWQARQVEQITKRFMFVHPQRTAIRHIVVSWPTWPSDKQAYMKLRKKSINMLKKLGIKGGLIVPHKRHDRIHFHCTCIGKLDRSKVRKNWTDTGVVIKDIRGVARAGSLANYELDHAIQISGVHTVSWFGHFHSYYIAKIERKERIQARCSCGSYLWQERDITHSDGGFEHHPPHYDLLCIVAYSWRHGPP